MRSVHDEECDEGELVLKEEIKGCTQRERFYYRPQGQTGIVLVSKEDSSDSIDWLQRIFLPQGYPNSVSKDYIAYQIWDTAQAFCSTITGILATQEVLRGVGVGDSSITPLAATITWILKDGCGHIGRIVFAYSHGSYLDAYSKKWRMYADILNDTAICLEMAIPLFRGHAAIALCLSTVIKSIVGIAGGATRVALTQHHAIQGNLADVSAKDSAQETAVNLVASVTALLILTMFGNSLVIFMALMVLHVIFNYLAVRAVCLRTFNEPRMLLAIDQYLRFEIAATPCQINRCEPIIFYQMGPCLLDLKLTGFRIKMGQSLKTVFREYPKAAHMNHLQGIYSETKYLLVPNIVDRTMHVLLKSEAAVQDTLCAYFHATLLAIITCGLNDVPLPFHKSLNRSSFTEVYCVLQAAEWTRFLRESRVEDCKFVYDPSYELMKYLNKIVKIEWPRINAGLKQAGWDLTKHLLITEQWRNNTGLSANPISIEKMDGYLKRAFEKKEIETREESLDLLHHSADISNDGNNTVEPERKLIQQR